MQQRCNLKLDFALSRFYWPLACIQQTLSTTSPPRNTSFFHTCLNSLHTHRIQSRIACTDSFDNDAHSNHLQITLFHFTLHSRILQDAVQSPSLRNHLLLRSNALQCTAMHCNALLQRYAIPQFILFSSPRFWHRVCLLYVLCSSLKWKRNNAIVANIMNPHKPSVEIITRCAPFQL